MLFFLLFFVQVREGRDLSVAAPAVEVIRLVVVNKGGQVLMPAAHGFAVLKQKERLVGGSTGVFLFERRGDGAVHNCDSQEAEAVSAQLESQLGVSVVLVDRQLMRVDYAVHMIW